MSGVVKHGVQTKGCNLGGSCCLGWVDGVATYVRISRESFSRVKYKWAAKPQRSFGRSSRLRAITPFHRPKQEEWSYPAFVDHYRGSSVPVGMPAEARPKGEFWPPAGTDRYVRTLQSILPQPIQQSGARSAASPGSMTRLSEHEGPKRCKMCGETIHGPYHRLPMKTARSRFPLPRSSSAS